jgi:hypothetical protein
MRSVATIVDWGGTTKVIEVSEVHGTWEGGCHIYIDRYYQGSIARINGEWISRLNKGCILSMDDVQILGALIDDAPAGIAS